jgi:hypothetical protein
MTDPRRRGLILSIVIVAMMTPLFAASLLGQREEPWPSLLAAQPSAGLGPDHVLLQDRANAALERVLRPDRMTEAGAW